MHKYADIINYNYIGDNKMSLFERSSQFAPFAALTSYGEAIEECDKVINTKIFLTDLEKEEISNKICTSLNKKINVTYFENDSYINYIGILRRIDEVNKIMIFFDKKKIMIEDIIYIEKSNI